jgi:tetratricopeptide (TPR) repeat protein
VRGAILAGVCVIAAACATSSADYFARMDAKGRRLIERQRWEEALRVSQTALAKCDQTDWCAKDPRFQGLFHNTIGEAEEHLGRRDQAMKDYRAAFYAYPLYFTENYFRMLKDAGMYRLLRREIDVKLANNETAYRSTTALWLPKDPSTCGGRSVAGSYGWRLRDGGAGPSGKVVVSQSGCVVSADFASPQEQAAGRPLRLRGDIGTGTAILQYGLPCLTSDRGQLVLQNNGFAVNANRTAVPGCPQGSYTIEFVKD